MERNPMKEDLLVQLEDLTQKVDILMYSADEMYESVKATWASTGMRVRCIQGKPLAHDQTLKWMKFMGEQMIYQSNAAYHPPPLEHFLQSLHSRTIT